MKTIIIDEAKWGPNYLLQEDGRMCCLGFLCEQLGAARETLYGVEMPTRLSPRGMPNELVEVITALNQRTPKDMLDEIDVLRKGTFDKELLPTIGIALARVNDDYHNNNLPRNKVIDIITQGFALLGLKAEFINTEEKEP